MIVTDAADLDWSYFFQIWDPNHHSGERMTENLDQILHANTAKTLRPAASPWVILVNLRFCIWTNLPCQSWISVILECGPRGPGRPWRSLCSGSCAEFGRDPWFILSPKCWFRAQNSRMSSQSKFFSTGSRMMCRVGDRGQHSWERFLTCGNVLGTLRSAPKIEPWRNFSVSLSLSYLRTWDFWRTACLLWKPAKAGKNLRIFQKILGLREKM